MSIQARDIYFIENFPPLDGHNEKGRYVVVILPPGKDGRVLVVGITTQPDFAAGREAIPVPNSRTVRACPTGLTKPSWALPDWRVLVHQAAFPPSPINAQPLNALTFNAIARAVKVRAARNDPPAGEIGRD